MSSTVPMVAGICCMTTFIVMILLLSSMSVLSYNEVGLNYSNWFKSVEIKTYENGIHFIGIGRTFLRYDIKLNTVEFSDDYDATLPMIKCRTSDGLELDLEASLQYRVEPENIFKIYTSYGPQEKAILTRVVIDVISDTASNYTSNDFF